MSKPLVYISGPITIGNTVLHVRKSCLVWEELRSSGLCVPIAPQWSVIQDAIWPITHEQWIEYDLELVSRCDAVLRLDGESKGADIECEFASKNEIPVFWTMSSLKDWLRRGSRQ